MSPTAHHTIACDTTAAECIANTARALEALARADHLQGQQIFSMPTSFTQAALEKRLFDAIESGHLAPDCRFAVAAKNLARNHTLPIDQFISRIEKFNAGDYGDWTGATQ